MKKEYLNICIITAGYPAPNNPGNFEFLDQLASAWADLGNKITVIYPIPLFVEFFDKSRYYKKKWIKKTHKGKKIKIICPRYFRVSDRKLLFFNTQILSYSSFQNAVIHTLKKMSYKPDVLYSHFLSSGCHVGDIGYQMGIPSFCAFGESSLWSIEKFDMRQVKNSLAKLSGIVSVSTENKRVLVDNGLFRQDDIGVFPNGVDHSLFFVKNKQEIRNKLGFPQDAFIGAYVGSFSDAKGVLRAQKAAIDAGDVLMIYIGGGSDKPEGSNILFCGKLEHDLIPDYLNASDFFILPTKAEGCCNAIIESMACGLPVISAEGAYNDDILSDFYSIRTHPDDVLKMTEAIKTLRDNPDSREKMGIAAKKASTLFDIENRAVDILKFIKNKI